MSHEYIEISEGGVPLDVRWHVFRETKTFQEAYGDVMGGYRCRPGAPYKRFRDYEKHVQHFYHLCPASEYPYDP